MRRGGIQDGRTSRKPQAIAIASTRFICFVFDNLTDWFIRLVLDVLGQDLQLPIADR